MVVAGGSGVRNLPCKRFRLRLAKYCSYTQPSSGMESAGRRAGGRRRRRAVLEKNYSFAPHFSDQGLDAHALRESEPADVHHDRRLASNLYPGGVRKHANRSLPYQDKHKKTVRRGAAVAHKPCRRTPFTPAMFCPDWKKVVRSPLVATCLPRERTHCGGSSDERPT